MSAASERLREAGVVVVPLLNINELEETRSAYLEAIGASAEFRRSDQNYQFVFPKFGALGNPSSFHYPCVRELRAWASNVARSVLPIQGFEHIEQLFDRVSVRRPGVELKASSTKWHRDESPAGEEDAVFGGFVNLDLHSEQHFRCVPGSHRRPNDGDRSKRAKTSLHGFQSTDDAKVHDEDDGARRATTIAVPPGHWLIFFSNIVHTVLDFKTDASSPSLRQYLGFRLTNAITPLFASDTQRLVAAQALGKHASVQLAHTEVISDLGVPLLPSGEVAYVFERNNWMYHLEQVRAWSVARFVDACLERRVKKSGKSKGEEYVIVHRHMKSLKEYGLVESLPAYSEEERAVMSPQMLR